MAREWKIHKQLQKNKQKWKNLSNQLQVIQMNNQLLNNINLTMKEDKKEIFKELIINYLLKQIKEEK